MGITAVEPYARSSGEWQIEQAPNLVCYHTYTHTHTQQHNTPSNHEPFVNGRSCQTLQRPAPCVCVCVLSRKKKEATTLQADNVTSAPTDNASAAQSRWRELSPCVRLSSSHGTRGPFYLSHVLAPSSSSACVCMDMYIRLLGPVVIAISIYTSSFAISIIKTHHDRHQVQRGSDLIHRPRGW